MVGLTRVLASNPCMIDYRNSRYLYVCDLVISSLVSWCFFDISFAVAYYMKVTTLQFSHFDSDITDQLYAISMKLSSVIATVISWQAVLAALAHDTEDIEQRVQNCEVDSAVVDYLTIYTESASSL